MNAILNPDELSTAEFLAGIKEMARSGETADLERWGDGKFVLGDGSGKWHYEGFVNLLQAVHEAMRAIDPSISEGLPPHVLDPEAIAKMFGIRLEDMNWPGKGKPETPRPAEPVSPKVVDSPYLTAEEGAAYLRTTVQGIYSLVKRGRLHPMPGRRILLFTRESLDKSMTARRRHR